MIAAIVGLLLNVWHGAKIFWNICIQSSWQIDEEDSLIISISWVRKTRLDKVTAYKWQKWAPVCLIQKLYSPVHSTAILRYSWEQRQTRCMGVALQWIAMFLCWPKNRKKAAKQWTPSKCSKKWWGGLRSAKNFSPSRGSLS